MDSESQRLLASGASDRAQEIEHVEAQESSAGDVIDRATAAWDETAGKRVDGEISRLEKYLNEKEACDPVYRAEREAARKKSETYERLEADLQSAAGEAAEWEGTKALRRQLEDLYPGKKPLDVVDTWLKLNQSYIADPAGTAEWHMQQLLAEEPVIAQARKDLPQDGSFDSAWRRADQHINERDAWTAIMDYAREKGISVREGLAQIIHHTKEGRRDPVYATARMAAQAGLPVAPMAQEAAALKEVQAAEHQALADGVQDGIEAVTGDRRLPGLDRAELQDTMADIIEHENFQSTGNLEHDLWNAYHLALHAENERLRETQTGETKRKANLSIGGGTPAEAGARSVPASSGEAIDRAFADLGG